MIKATVSSLNFSGSASVNSICDSTGKAANAAKPIKLNNDNTPIFLYNKYNLFS